MTDRSEYRLDTTIDEFGRYAWGFFLYCAGRRSYAPSICEEVLERNAHILLFPWRAQIIARIMEAFASTFDQRVAANLEKAAAKAIGDPDWWEKGYKGGPLGAEYDEDGWVKTATYLAKHDNVDPSLVNANWDAEDAPVVATFADVDDFWFMVGSVLRHDLAQNEDAVFTADEITRFVKAHADDLNPKWVTNLYRDVSDSHLWAFGDNREPPLPEWRELHDFLIEVSTQESPEVWEKRKSMVD